MKGREKKNVGHRLVGSLAQPGDGAIDRAGLLEDLSHVFFQFFLVLFFFF